jgi:hypothetical protein
VNDAGAEGARPSQRLVSLIRACQERSPHVCKEFDLLFRTGFPRHPIPFFGRLETARVLTVGLNPSTTEFEARRCWLYELTTERLAQRLYNYFKLPYPPPHPWFGDLHQGLRIINCSYDAGAAHIDASPWPTLGPGCLQKRNLLSSYKALLASEIGHLSHLLDFCPNLNLVIILIADPERSLAMSAIARRFRGRVETVRKNQLAPWVWKNRRELAALVESKAVDCPS